MSDIPASASAEKPEAWQTTVTVPHAAVGTFEIMMGDDALAVSSIEIPPGDDWIVEIITETEPDTAQMTQLAQTAATVAQIEMPEVEIAPLQAQDWVQMSLGKLAPVRADRFYLYGEHDRGTTPYGAIGLEVNAGQAFGTGQHGTTKGCLLALSDLSRKLKKRPKRVLDVGTGTGVLALAAAKLWHCPVVATDIDILSVIATSENAEKNNVLGIQALEAGGTSHPMVARRAPYDIITANILAKPLIALAGDMDRVAAHGAYVILSGLLDTQVNAVLAAYRARGMVFRKQWDMGQGPYKELGHNWQVLMLQKP